MSNEDSERGRSTTPWTGARPSAVRRSSLPDRLGHGTRALGGARMVPRLLVGGAAALVLAVAALTATSGAAARTALAAATKPVLTIGETSGPPSLDAPSGNDVADFGSTFLAYEGPFYYRPGNETKLIPALATSWHVFDGGKTLAFTLRHDARFDDGQLVTAQAYKRFTQVLRQQQG